MEKFLLIFIFLLLLTIGVALLGMGLFDTMNYFLDYTNPARYEYIQGALISTFFATPFWVIASLITSFIKDLLPNGLLRIINAIALGMILFFIFINVYPFMAAVFNF